MSPYPFTLLGKGSRHDVYAFVNIPAVVKYHRRALHNEEPFKRGFDLGEKAYKALRDSTEIIKSLDSGVFIPEFRGYYPKEQEIRWHWPPGEQPTPEKMRATIEMELIPSLNMEQKKRLIKKYCPKNDHLLLINQADETTVHCICTLSLAKWSSVRELVVEDFHLREFPLHASSLSELNIDLEKIAQNMAHGLAIIHWKAQLDGYGIIFVLGGRPLLTMPSPETAMTWQQFASRSDRNAFLNSCVWIHHFEGCCEISFTMLGVEAIVHAMISSHPAYPRPNEAGMKLWTVFETRYLEVSAAVLEGQEDAVKVLPKKVMDVFKENQEFIDSDSDYSLSS